MKPNLSKPCLFLLATTILGTGCDGGDVPLFGPEPEKGKEISGQFLDSAVSNLDYRSPTSSGTTDEKGTFTYREGETVTFSIGKVTLGSAQGEPVITPVDLIPDGSSTQPAVQNIARFLLALDSDEDPTNGIHISPAVKTAADNWAPIDFTSNDFATEIAGILSDAGSADGRTITLPTASEARGHLEQTIYCANGGAFSGTFSDPAGYNGEWMALVDPGTGGITGVVTTSSGSRFQLQGSFSADAAGTISAETYPMNTLSPWQGTLSSGGVLRANSGSVFGTRKEAEIPGTDQGTLYKGSLAKGNLDEITDVYALSFIVDGTTVTARAYSLTSGSYVDIQPTWIDANSVQFALDGIDLLAGGISSGGYITIGGSNGNDRVIGTACKAP